MEVPRHWRLKQQRYRLIGEQCPHCDFKIFPPRDICPRCGGGTLKNNLEAKVGTGDIFAIGLMSREGSKK
jgi:hypothetical protein